MKQRHIFFFWLPLALSWLLMTIEGPWIQAVISRKADAETQLAAFGLVFSLSVTIEAPVIMMLATGNALARDGQSYRVLWRYMMLVNGLVTLLAALMAFTPLLDAWLGGVLGVPQHIIDATRPGMAIMILWSALIGYRRFQQGVMIRHNHTRAVGVGTLIRIAASGGVALLLGLASDLPGAVIGAWALIMAVVAEALYVYWKAQPDVELTLSTPRRTHLAPLTTGAVLRFHLPLAVTSVLTLLTRPLVESALANSPNAEAALAAYPVVFAILLLMRSGGMAWQEVVLTLSTSPLRNRALQRFTWGLGIITSALLLLMAFTPLIDLYTGAVLGIPAHLQGLVVTGVQFVVLVPLLTTLQSYLRALLMLADSTSPIYQAMSFSLLLTAGILFLGIRAGDMPALAVAGIALSVGAVGETLYLWWAQRHHQEGLQHFWQQEAAPAGD